MPAPKKSPRPTPNPRRSDPVTRGNRAAEREARDYESLLPQRRKAGGKISEYGGKETYSSAAAKRRHESGESAMEERAERMSYGGKVKKMMNGGTCRGMGKATRGGNYSRG